MTAPGPAALCPSSRCEDGALLLGVVQGAGVAFLPEPLRVDARFDAIAREGRAPERRFRFAGPCQEGRCRQWTGARCGVADRVVALMGPSDAALPRCAIRASCRWWGQAGPPACRACRFVVTDLTPEGEAAASRADPD